jgi:cbb3-type cytochrome oxidase maturation protein
VEILWLLVPVSALIVLAIIAVFGWALKSGQFDDLEREGERILDDAQHPVDPDQGSAPDEPEQFSKSRH